MRARVVASACGVALAVACAAAAAVAVALAPSAPGDARARHAANNPFAASLISECVRAKRPQRVRALAFDGTTLPRSVVAGDEPGSRPRCRADELRLLRLEALSIDGTRTYVRRGGCARPCIVRQPTVHVPAGALARPSVPLPHAARNGNGEPHAGCTERARNAPQRAGPALRRMYYKTPDDLRERRNAGRSGGAGARWSNYGDPGGTYRSPAGRRAHYNYLLWNLPRTRSGLLAGGGIIRAILRAGQPLSLCPGERLTLAAFDKQGRPDGEVDFGYAKVRSAGGRGSYAIHGWVLLGYRHEGQIHVATVIG